MPLADILCPRGQSGPRQDDVTAEDRRSAALARLQASRGKYKRAGALLDEARRADRNNAEPDPHLAQMSPSELEELFKADSGVRLEIPAHPTPETAAVRLACLALGLADVL